MKTAHDLVGGVVLAGEGDRRPDEVRRLILTASGGPFRERPKHYVLGLVARSENEPEAGAREFAEVLRLDPRDLGARVGLGQVYLDSARHGFARGAGLVPQLT